MKTFLALLVIILFFIFRFFKRSSAADRLTLLPITLWGETLERAPTEKERNRMCLSAVYQALVQLEVAHIYSRREFSDVKNTLGVNFSFSNFVQNIMEYAPPELMMSEEFERIETRAFFAYLLATIIEQKGKNGLERIILESTKPHNPWD